jgi:NRAMP (natural resistance-associated macrophage protein)-like metal ion transporter
MQENKKKSMWERIKKSFGPGVVTGIADDDPSGIATYAQTGALFGFSQLWLALFSFPFMSAIQEMCGRIGMVTGTGLAGIIKKYYSKKILFFAVFLLAVANIINIGADLGAMASATQLILPEGFPFWLALIILTIVTILAEVFIPYPSYVKFLKYMALTVFAYVITAFMVKQDWGDIAHFTLVPHIQFTKEYALNIVAVIGTTISPYLFFWQADEEVEEEIVQGKIRSMGKGVPKIAHADVNQMRTDTITGMLVSNIITFFIIITSAKVFGSLGIHEVTSAAQLAQSLEPIAGNFASLLFTIAILGTGLLAVPVLAGSAAYALSEAFHWNEGLSKKFSQAKGFYVTIIVATLIGVFINFSSISPITMLYYAAALNGVLAPPLMVLILLIGNNKKILGEYTNSRTSNILGIIITVLMSIMAIIFLGTMF